uniref:DRBM domain-containing protein n=1 Tax=Trichuris muris TaxID=70415 RepID=A0A5S6QEL3_TRIMR
MLEQVQEAPQSSEPRKVSVQQKVTYPSEHLQKYARRNGFGCEYEVNMDKASFLFRCKLTVGEWTTVTEAKSKKEAKHAAAVNMLKQISVIKWKERESWGLPREGEQCNAYLNNLATLVPCRLPQRPSDVSDCHLESTPRTGHIMELKRLCGKRCLKLRFEVNASQDGKVTAVACLCDGRRFTGEGPSKRKAMAAAAFECIKAVKFEISVHAT